MKIKALFVALVLVAFTSGCATHTTTGGGKETSILAGVVTVSTGSFQPIPPATVDADTSAIVGKNGPSGNKTTLLWGLITLHDY